MKPRLIGLDGQVMLRTQVDVPAHRSKPCPLRRARHTPSAREHIRERAPRYSAAAAGSPRPDVKTISTAPSQR